MNASRHTTLGIVVLLGASMTAIRLVAQAGANDTQGRNHRRYKVIDTGSFGGPNSHMSLGSQILNNNGTFTGFADTSVPDPYAPDGCWDGDCLVAHASQWKDGKLTDLGVLDGGPNSETNWISANGLIAGDSQNGLLDPLTGGWEIRAAVWEHHNIVDIGTLDDGSHSLARAVNSSGEVVGLSTTTTPDPNSMIMTFGLPFPFQTRAYRWKNGVIRDLGTLGGPDAMALGVNERGQIFGNSYTNSDPSPGCSFPGFNALTTGAFLWQSGRMMNLGSLGGTCTNASAMNNSGQVIGYSFLEGDEVFHPFRWDRGNLTDLGTLGGSFGDATNLNEKGEVAGWVTLPGNDNVVHATLWSHGGITDLGALGPDQCSTSFGINSGKQVVGAVSLDCDFFDDASLRAFLWEPGGPMIDLNTLISPSLGIQLRNVATINEWGEMAVVAFFPDGSHRPVLLIPCDDRSTNSDDCQDSINPETTHIQQRSSTLSLSTAAPSRFDSRSVPMKLRERLARSYDTNSQTVQRRH
jgi:probable HAF family extracellular repeat protein